MRITFRLTLTSILLTMLVATVTSIGLVSYLFGRESVESLSHKVTEQTLGRIEQRIDSFLKVAVAISTFGRNLAAAGQVDPRDFPEMQAFFSQAMAVRDELTYLGLGLETGEYCFVERKHDGDLLIREMGSQRISFGRGDANHVLVEHVLALRLEWPGRRQP